MTMYGAGNRVPGQPGQPGQQVPPPPGANQPPPYQPPGGGGAPPPPYQQPPQPQGSQWYDLTFPAGQALGLGRYTLCTP